MAQVLGTILTVVAMVMYLYYTFFVIHLKVRIPIIQPPIYDHSKRCRNLLLSMSKGGKWKRKNQVTAKDESARKETDSLLRVRKGWPENLAHGDLFCGAKFPLPRYTKNQSEVVAFDIPAQCDAHSETPCCHGDMGLCGNGPEFCTCPSCTDYRLFVSAELAEWIPDENCAIQTFTQAQACSILSRAVSSIIFIGDSLVRHFFSALRIILTNNPKQGSLKRNTSPKYLRLCQGENQFTDGMCHAHIEMQGDDVCTGKRRKFHTSFIEAYNVKHVDLAVNITQTLLGIPFTYVLVGIGIHDNFSSKTVINNYLEPIVKLVSSKGRGWPRIVWLTTHAAGPLKPLKYIAKQGNEVITKYNNDISRYCQKNNITLFDTFNMTKTTYSYDGTHYGLGVNKVKTQVLLNFIEDQWHHRTLS